MAVSVMPTMSLFAYVGQRMQQFSETVAGWKQSITHTYRATVRTIDRVLEDPAYVPRSYGIPERIDAIYDRRRARFEHELESKIEDIVNSPSARSKLELHAHALARSYRSKDYLSANLYKDDALRYAQPHYLAAALYGVSEPVNRQTSAPVKHEYLMSLKDIAQLTGLSTYMVRKHAQELGVVSRREANQKLRERQIAYVQTHSHMPVAMIAGELGISASTVYKYRIKDTPRPPEQVALVA